MRENFQYIGVRQKLVNVGERSLLEMEGGDHMEEEKTWQPSEGRRGEGGAMRDEGSMRTLSTAKETCGGYLHGLVSQACTHGPSSEMNQFNKGTGQLFLCWTHSLEFVCRNASVKNYLTLSHF